MDIVITRDALLKPLQAVTGVVEKKQTLPILSNVLLQVKDNQLRLTGTDLEIELVCFAPLESCTDEGVTTVSARKLFEICRTLPDAATLRLSMEKNNLVVRTGESCFVLNTLPPTDFPSLEESEYPTSFSIKQSYLKTIFSKTYFAMGQQDVRHYLNGAYLDITPNTIKCVAADGHRLALASVSDDDIGDVDTRIILPRKSVLELMRLFGTDDDDVAHLSIGDSRFRVQTQDFIFTSKLINAQYPDYNRLIPKSGVVATGEREQIKDALTRAAILSNEKFRGVRFQLAENKLRISANNADQEHAEDAVSLDYTGNEMEIGFNVSYLLDIVSSVTTNLLKCSFSDPNSGVLIEPDNDDSCLYVVMPMRL